MLWISHKAELGGAELGLAEGVKALAECGWSSHVVLPCEGPLADKLSSAEGIHICHHNPWTVTRRRPVSVARWTAYNLLRARPELGRVVSTVSPDVVLTNTVTIPMGAVAARDAGVPHVWFLHEFGRQDHGIKFVAGSWPTLRAMSRLSQLGLVNSEALRSHFKRAFGWKRLRVVHYAVDVPETEARSRPAASLRAVLVGAMKPGKGQQDAIRAVALLAARGVDVRLTLVGSGEPAYESRLRRLVAAQSVGERVRFVPFQDNPHELVAAADVALMCSRAEAFGRVTVEAMKAGKPVIGSSSGATPELVRHAWNGLLYPPGDVAALASRLAQLERDRELARLMGARGREWAAAHFDLRRYGRDLDAALSETVAAGLT